MVFLRLFKHFWSSLNSTFVHAQRCSCLIALIPPSQQHPLRQLNWQMFSDYQFTNSDTSLSRYRHFLLRRVTMSVFHIITKWLEHRHTWERRPSSFSKTKIHLLFSPKRSHSIWWVQAAAAWAHFLFQMVIFAMMFDVKTETPRSFSELSLETSNLHDWPQAKKGRKPKFPALEGTLHPAGYDIKGGWKHLYTC